MIQLEINQFPGVASIFAESTYTIIGSCFTFALYAAYWLHACQPYYLTEVGDIGPYQSFNWYSKHQKAQAPNNTVACGWNVWTASLTD